MEITLSIKLNQQKNQYINKAGLNKGCLFSFLFKPIRIPLLPVPAIPDHLIDSILRTPAKLTLSLLFLPCSQVIRNQATVVLDRLKSVHVASGEVHNVDVVPDAGAIRCVIVVPENMQLLQLSRCTLGNTRPLMSLAIYRNQSIGVVRK